MAVIINADDLGISEDVNAAIFDLMERGFVTSATLIANGPAIEPALSRTQSFRSCSFGVHLNATEFRPLTQNPDLAPLLDDKGAFRGDIIRTIKITGALKGAIFREWSAQIARLTAFGLKPSHIDSHHHVHTIPALFPVLKRLQYCCKIRKVRISKNVYGTSDSVSRRLLIQKKAWNLALRNIYRTRTTTAFTSLLEYYELVQNGAIERWLPPNWKKDTTVELMVHPGNIGQMYRSEVAVLCSGWLDAMGIAKTSYVQL